MNYSWYKNSLSIRAFCGGWLVCLLHIISRSKSTLIFIHITSLQISVKGKQRSLSAASGQAGPSVSEET